MFVTRASKHFTDSHNKHFTASSMKDLFDNVAAQNIINFIIFYQRRDRLGLFVMGLATFHPDSQPYTHTQTPSQRHRNIDAAVLRSQRR